jgi:hypothetical protein
MISKMTRVLFICLTTLLVLYGGNIVISDPCPKVKPASARCIADMAAEFGSCSPDPAGAPCSVRSITTNQFG